MGNNMKNKAMATVLSAGLLLVLAACSYLAAPELPTQPASPVLDLATVPVTEPPATEAIPPTALLPLPLSPPPPRLRLPVGGSGRPRTGQRLGGKWEPGPGGGHCLRGGSRSAPSEC